MTKIFLIRHAEAEGNIFRRAHGQYNGQIIGRGYAQIERLRSRFEHERIDAVYSSDLSRACVTASAIYKPHGLPLNTTERLREVKMGAWEDMPWGDIEHDDSEMSRYFNIDPAKWRVPEGEEFHHVQKRMKDCILEIAGKHDGETVAVFSHGFSIRAFICGILGLKSSDIRKVPYFDNTAVTLLRCDGDQITVEYQGDNSHLSNEHSTFANQTWWRSKRERVFENLRILPLDEDRDRLLLERFVKEAGKDIGAIKEYTAFLDEDAIGLVGVDNGRRTVDSGQLKVDSERRIVDSQFGDVGWIRYIYVRPELRSHNFGIQLLGQAVSFYRKIKRERLRICLPEDNTTLGFFEKFEFSKISDADGYNVLEKSIRNWN